MTDQGNGKVIDGKYEVLRELAVQGSVTLSEVRAAEGVTRQVAWFNVASPAERQAFHTYRSALRALAPAGLTDVVARPGAYYAVWQPVTGQPLDTALAQKVKPQELIDGVQALSTRLAEQGYALDDAQVVVEGTEPRLAYLTPLPAPRSAEDLAARNARFLTPLRGGRVKKKREPGGWLTFIPGLLLLGGAGYLGAQAAQTYLNPPVREVTAVTGQDALRGARLLAKAGFRVTYNEGQAGGRPIGSVIRQDPPAGTNLPVGRLVTLTVNNPPAIEVPRLEEMNLDQARDALKDRAMTVGKVVKVDGTLTSTPEGRIVAQLPEAGSSAQQGQPVQLMVSTGISGKETWLPNLGGMTYDQAREYARAAGLVVTSVTPQPSDRAAGTVLEQTPAAFVRVKVGSAVKLTVATSRYSAPSRPAGDLPLPPAPLPTVPEQPTEPEPAPVDSGVTDPVVPDSQPVTPDEIPPVPVTESRSVSFAYTFPTDLPEGTYTLAVQDETGERPLDFSYAAADIAGQRATTTATVTGDAVFIIRRDGADFATVTP
ncbi:PASTA domain-containing protein [Deinococcus sp. HMF7620]|uniref:PASTA domain-containing protein n=1 Tax=Deinococcus arboris TaxID=2682977 RepID=A0A7C9M679_9DEIO|nr:PASTA domain-containing protein [Deinococcus arboris]MVN85543.1 PASTA domain-containing protein [Deinococcus arboris]